MLIKRMRERGESKISLYYPRGFGASPQLFRERHGVFSVYWVFKDNEANSSFFFVLLQDLRTLAQFHLSPRLFHDFMDGYMKY